jgi:hypothetical protein
MTASTRARALRAAAKLVVGVSWCGACGGTLGTRAEGDAGSSAPAGDADTLRGDALAGAESGTGAAPRMEASVDLPLNEASADSALADAPLACALTRDADGGLTGQAVDCCFALTLSMLPDSGFSIDAGSWKSDPSLLGCCSALNASGWLAAPAYASKHWSQSACQACAQTIGVNGTQCIPWGPPVPPSMPASMDLVS